MKVEISTNDPNEPNDENMHKNKQLYAWSIYGNLHTMDFDTFKWDVVPEYNLDQQP